MITNMGSFWNTTTVQAARIIDIQVAIHNGMHISYLDKDQRPAFFVAPWEWWDRYRPCVGWYLLQYKDGYLTTVPPEQFEETSIRIDN